MRSADHPIIIHLDSDPQRRRARSEALRATGYKVIDAASEGAALLAMAEAAPALVLVGPCFDALAELHGRITEANDPVVLRIGGAGASETENADCCLPEPVASAELIGAARVLLRLRDERRENRRLRAELARSAGARRESVEIPRDSVPPAFEDVSILGENAAFDADLEHKTIRCSAELCALAGLSAPPADLDAALALVHPDDRRAALDLLRRACAPDGSAVAQCELRVVRPGGEAVWAVLRCAARFTGAAAERRATRLLGTITDISARKSAEQQLQQQNMRLRLLGRAAEQLLVAGDTKMAARDLFAIVRRYIDVDAYLDYALDEHSRTLALESAEGVAEEILRERGHLALGERCCGMAAARRAPLLVERLQQAEDPGTAELRRAGFGAYVCHPLLVGDRLLGTFAFATRRPAFEPDEIESLRTICQYLAVAKDRLRLLDEARRQADRLERSELRLQLAVDAAEVGIYDWNLQTVEASWDDRLRAHWGMRPGSPVTFDIFMGAIHPADRAAARAAMDAALDPAGNRRFDIEFRVIGHDDKLERWIRTRGQAFMDSGRPARLLGTTVELTERKRAEAELIRLRDRLAAELQEMIRLQELGSALLLEDDFERMLGRIIDACNQLFGTDKGSMQFYDEREQCLRLVAQRGFDQRFVERYATVSADSGTSCAAVLRERRRVIVEDLAQESGADADGFLRARGAAAVQSTPLCGRGGRLIGVLSSYFSTPRQLTERELRLLNLYVQQAERVLERRQAERDLRESEERLALALTAGHSGVWDLDLVSGAAQVSDTFCALHGFAAAAAPVSYKRWLAGLNKIDRRRLLRYNQELLRGGVEFEFEYRWRHPQYGDRWLIATGRLVRDPAGRPVRLIGVNRDITDQKLAALAQFRLAAIVENSRDAIISIHLDGAIASWNQGAESLYGYGAGEIVGQPLALLSPAEGAADALELIKRIAMGEAVEHRETRQRRRDGSEFDAALTISPVRSNSGEVIGASQIVRDITARVTAEARLRSSEEQLRLAQSAAHVGIWDWRLDSDELSWSAEMVNIYGVAEPLSKIAEWRKLVHADDLPRIEAEREEATRRGEPFNVEYRIAHGSGETRWIASRGRAYQDSEGRLIRVLGINMDVTERRRAEEDRLKFQALVESSLDYISMAEPGGNSIYLNPAGRALVGIESPEEARGQRPVDFVPEQWRGYFQETVLPELLTRGVWEGELPLRHRQSGASIDAYRAFFLVKDPVTGAPMCIANVSRDIRERKRAEMALRESEQRFRALADSAPVLIWINDSEGAQFCNSAYRSFVGVADDAELSGFRWAEFLHPDDREEYLAAYQRAFDSWQRFEADVRLRRADGQYRWIKSLGAPRFTQAGVFLGYAGCSIDIHNAKIAEMQLALLAALINSSSDAIYSFTLGAVVLSWNRGAEALFGWTEAEVLGKRGADFLDPDAAQEIREVTARITAGEPVLHLESKRRRKDGSTIDVALTYSPVVAQEKVIAISAIARDVTARKRADEDRERQARLLDLSLDAIIVWSYAGRAIEYWNEGAEKLYGYSAEEALGRDVHALLHSDVGEARRRLQEAGEWDGRLVHRQKSGGQIAVLSRMQRISRAQGDVVLEVNRDITLIEEAELAVSEAAAHIKAIVDTAVDGIVTIDEHGSIESLNPAAERIFGFWREEVVGSNVELLMPGLSESLAGAGSDTLGAVREFDGRRKDGSAFPLDIGLSETRSGGTRFYTCLVRDATERRQFEQALVEAKNAADAANRAKSEFLANMSHEIRNPLTGIMGYADLLLARLQDRAAIECARTIKESGQYLLQIINDLLDLAKIEAQALEIEKEEMHLPAFLTDVYTLMEGAARAKSLPLSLKYDGRIPYVIEGDPKRLRQILINLLGNAIKFTERGGVELAVRFDSDSGELQVSVSDSGIGMTQEQQQNLFKPFTQGDSSMRKVYGGTGLGLAITKRLVEALGGRIAVTSVAGVGSTFRVSVPVRVVSGDALRGADLAPQSGSAPRLSGVRVAIVEDQSDIRRLIESFVEDAGAAAETYPAGEDILRAVEEHGAQRFDAILMDIQMPRMDGCETTRRLRAGGVTSPIIAVTAGAMAADQENCLAAGCSDYVPKPVDMPKLLETIARAVATARESKERAEWREPTLWQAGEPESGRISYNEPVRRVLVVDDRPVALNAVRGLLEMYGCEVRTAASGHAAIRAAREFRPQYIFLDISLPDISGYEVFRQLKSSDELAGSKFIALSGHGREENMRARKAGFDGYITKPVDIREMEKLISGARPADSQ